MKALYCPKCGAPNLKEQGQNYKCLNCGSLLADDYVRAEKEQIKSLFDEALAGQKEEQIANLRKNLWNAAREENISSTKVLQYAREIKKLLPEDFMANFYEVACGENVKVLNKFLNNINDKLGGIYAADIAQFLVRGMEYSTVLPLKNLISRHLKDDEYKKYMTAVEDEAQKIKNGVYSPQVPRDVFLTYSSKDHEAVNEIVEFLEENGISCFVALRNLRHGKGSVENYGNELKTAMHNCKCVVFLSSNNSRSLECDALKIELPYIRDYEPKMGRIEYLLEEYKETSYAAKKICEEFFKDLEYCRDKEDLVDRILKYITGFTDDRTEAAPKPNVKYCLNCGAENPERAKKCMECGGKEFVATHEEYAIKKQQAEYEQKLKAQQEKFRLKIKGEAAQKPANKGAALYRREENLVWFGLWPQSKKESNVTVNGDADKNGYYTGSDGNKYAKIVNNYCKVEPIKWWILCKKFGKALILCEDIIAYMQFDSKRNNYANSEVRKWLNGEFLNKAFTPLEQAKIITTKVDNSLLSTLDDSLTYVCKDTRDKIFLLSCQEAFRKYQLTNVDLHKDYTDYVSFTSSNINYKLLQEWWLRSPCSDSADHACAVTGEHPDNVYVGDYYGIVPAMWIKL